jgi:hypothetical protein
MTDLRLVAVTPDRSHLVLEDDQSHQFHLPIDERLANALRSPRSSASTSAAATPGQLEIALESQLTPREIQSRIRAGRSLIEVAAAAGIAEDRVERYAAPVLAEREHVADQAKLAPARRASGGSAPRLGDLVTDRLARTGDAPTRDAPTRDGGGAATEQAATEQAWDAWRGEDDGWTVVLSYHADGRDRVAEWSFDPRGRVLSPANDEARWLVDESAPDRAEDGSPVVPVRRLASVPAAPDADPAAADGAVPDPAAAQARVDEVYDREADEARERARAAAQSGQSGRPARPAGRRPAVPSWDDIMFGTRRSDGPEPL